MGLDSDMYAFKGDECEQVAEWRKHGELHAWMAKLGRSKGFNNDYEGFNGESVTLTLEDLASLKIALLAGCFDNDKSRFLTQDEFITEQLEIINNARNYINAGWKVTFSSSF